jgi:predicted RNA binding protein YcfA (HicA-like mRNA interferase family)
MKIPRDLSGWSLIGKLKRYGYEPTRQTGSHIRLTTQFNGEHHITIPNHNPLKIGTLSSILDLVAEHFQISKVELLEQLFG